MLLISLLLTSLLSSLISFCKQLTASYIVVLLYRSFLVRAFISTSLFFLSLLGIISTISHIIIVIILVTYYMYRLYKLSQVMSLFDAVIIMGFAFILINFLWFVLGLPLFFICEITSFDIVYMSDNEGSSPHDNSSSSSDNSSQGGPDPEPGSDQSSVAHGDSSSQGSNDDQDESSANQSDEGGHPDPGPVAECEHGQWIRYPIYSENELCAGAGDRYHNGVPLEHYAYNLNDEQPLMCNHCLGVFCADCTDYISGHEVPGDYRYVDPDNCAQFSTGSYARDSSQANHNASVNDDQSQSSSDDSEQ